MGAIFSFNFKSGKSSILTNGNLTISGRQIYPEVEPAPEPIPQEQSTALTTNFPITLHSLDDDFRRSIRTLIDKRSSHNSLHEINEPILAKETAYCHYCNLRFDNLLAYHKHIQVIYLIIFTFSLKLTIFFIKNYRVQKYMKYNYYYMIQNILNVKIVKIIFIIQQKVR